MNITTTVVYLLLFYLLADDVIEINSKNRQNFVLSLFLLLEVLFKQLVKLSTFKILGKTDMINTCFCIIILHCISVTINRNQL